METNVDVERTPLVSVQWGSHPSSRPNDLFLGPFLTHFSPYEFPTTLRLFLRRLNCNNPRLTPHPRRTRMCMA